MRFPRILSLYLAREVLQYATVGFLAFGSLFVAQNLFNRLDSFVGIGFHWSDFFVVLRSVLSLMAGYLLPVGFLFGVLVAVGRMSADSEVVAMRASGMGLRQLVLPILAVAVPISIFSAVMLTTVEPDARRELRAVWRTVLSRGAFLAPGKFIGVGDRVVFVESVSEEKELEGVVIADRTDPEHPFMVVAEGGRFYLDEDGGALHLELDAGDIHFEPSNLADDEYRRIGFARFDYPVESSELMEENVGKLKPRDMRTDELRDIIARGRAGDPLSEYRYQDVNIYVSQWHRRYALACTPILFALVGTPLALRRARGGRASGALWCALLVFVYYALLTFGESMGEAGTVSPQLAIWVPNVVFGLAALPLIGRNLRSQI